MITSCLSYRFSFSILFGIINFLRISTIEYKYHVNMLTLCSLDISTSFLKSSMAGNYLLFTSIYLSLVVLKSLTFGLPGSASPELVTNTNFQPHSRSHRMRNLNHCAKPCLASTTLDSSAT